MATIWLRWAAVLPAALLAIPLAPFPLHWVLYSSLTGSGFIEPYPQTPERILTPLAISTAFVWAGSRVAPKFKIETAVVLCGLWLLVVGGFVALSLAGARVGRIGLTMQYGGLGAVLAVAGAFAGVLTVRHDNTPSAGASNSAELLSKA